MTFGSPAPGALPDNGFEYRESAVAARVRKDRASVYANVGVHANVEILLDVQSDGDGAEIMFGDTGPDLILGFADLDSMERLAAVAAEGVRQMRERLAVHWPGGANRLVAAGAGVAP